MLRRKLIVYICLVFSYFAYIDADPNLQQTSADSVRLPQDTYVSSSPDEIVDPPQRASCDCENGKCELEGGKEVCKCKPGYGNFTRSYCKACECGTNSSCMWVKTGWISAKKVCICKPGYYEKKGKCEGTPCSSAPCHNGGKCTVSGNNFTCDCVKPYSGKTCDNGPCTSGPCKNNGTCEVYKLSFKCNCTLPWKGNTCEEGPCSSDPCKNGGTCKVDGPSFKCNCKPPYSGSNCTTGPCSPDPCKNNGTCKVDGLGFECACKHPFGGKTCETVHTSSTIPTSMTTKPSTRQTFLTVSTTKRIPASSSTITKRPIPTETTLTIKNFTETNNITTYEPSNNTFNFNWTTYEPTNFTKFYNWTTFEPSNFTGVSNWTTFTPSNFTGVSNWTTFTPSNFTEVLNTTYKPSSFTDISNWTTFEPSNFTFDNNITTYEPRNFTYNLNVTTYEPTNFTYEFNMTTYEPSNITNDKNASEIVPTSLAFSTTVTTKKPGPCDNDPCQNGGTCVEEGGAATCQCPPPFSGENCTDSAWCTDGEGKELCRGGGCTYDVTLKLGRCTCAENQFYDYEVKQCKAVDLCLFKSIKCNEENNEVCKKGVCQCKDGFVVNDAKKCVPNFCALKPCEDNEDCEDVETDPGYVKCMCKKGYVFNGTSCVEGNLCNIPNILNCEQRCNFGSESCECFPGFTLKSDNKTCERENSTELCSKNCNGGSCVKVDGNDTCLCPNTHVSNGDTCIDLCTAKQVPEGLCPDHDCVLDKDHVFKCKCEGNLTYDDSGVTCRRKLMCSEGIGKESCKKRNAICMEDFDDKDGFACVCDKGLSMDTDGTCKKKCELSQQRDECAAKGATCDMDGFDTICRCPPLLMFGPDGRCSDFVNASYSGELLLSLERYSLKKLFSLGLQAEPRDDSINIDDIRQDLRASMHALYGDKYRFADVLNCRIEDQKLRCFVEIQFQSDPQEQMKLIDDSNTCLSTPDKNTCFIPPRLAIDKANQKAGTFVETDPCLKIISKNYCGRDTECKKGKGFSFECTCSEGLESYSILKPLRDPKTVVHQCQDIDECEQETACPNTTTCVNTYRSYKCMCLKGFKPPADDSDLKQIGCVDVCQSRACIHGKCEVVGDVFGCNCYAGYTGVDCNQALLNTAEIKEMKVALIILAVFVVPLILLSIFMIYQYRILKKRTFTTGYFDDQSSTINLQPLKNETDD